MLDVYIAMAEQHCAAPVAANIFSLDLADSETSSKMNKLYQTLYTDDPSSCLEAFVGYMSYSLNSRTAYEVVRGYLDLAGKVHPLQLDVLRDAVAHAYTQINYDVDYHDAYFMTAGIYGIPLSPTFHERLAPTPFYSHTQEAYSYHAYLVLIEDPRGIEGFQAALTRAQPNVNELGNLVSGLSDLAFTLKYASRDPAPILRILAPLRNDTRRTKGVTGEGGGSAIQDKVNSLFLVFDPK